jgi:hypothetical protein
MLLCTVMMISVDKSTADSSGRSFVQFLHIHQNVQKKSLAHHQLNNLNLPLLSLLPEQNSTTHVVGLHTGHQTLVETC